jgi:NTP pyrophosphatase (non-canonical NTP hydrolase)
MVKVRALSMHYDREHRMDFRDYQREASKTDQVPGSDEKSLMVPLLGLAGESGSLLTEFKKRLRDGPAYRIFKERIADELGDILWYVANIATKSGLDLEDIAHGNLTKTRERWWTHENTDLSQGTGARLFDEDFPSHEQFPRYFEIRLEEVTVDGPVREVILTMNGEQIGNALTDNAYDDDGYRFHDVFHLTHVAILGWSPVIRALMKRNRKSNLKIDEVEDGARAIVVEEAIAALVFNYAKDCSFFEGVDSIDYSVLSNIKNLTSHLEVKRCSTGEWARAILEGYAVWRQVRREGKGTIIGDLASRTIQYKPLA